MTFFQRFVSLARADAHGVLDSLEDRGLVLRQCLREAELEVARKRMRTEELDSALELLARQREQLAARGSALDEDVRLALGREEEDLARFSIRRLLSLRNQSERIEEQVRSAREEREKVAEKLGSQERELELLRERVREALERERSSASNPDTGPDEPCGAVRDEEVELELLRRRSRAGSAS